MTLSKEVPRDVQVRAEQEGVSRRERDESKGTRIIAILSRSTCDCKPTC